MKLPPPPAGFAAVEATDPRSGASPVGFVRPEEAPRVRDELARHGSLHAASLGWEDPIPLVGRGRLVAARPPGTPGGRWVARPYLRGGWMSPLLGDRHLALGTPRPWAEARAVAALDAAGIPTAPVVAGVVYPGWPWYRAEIVTAYLPDTRDLAALLFGPDPVAPSHGRRALLAAAGRIPYALAEAGVVHRDLNAKNLLAAAGPGAPWRSEGGAPLLHVIDLDRARVGPAGSGAARTMATRLARSLDKFGARRGPPLTPEEWAVFRTPPPADAPPAPAP